MSTFSNGKMVKNVRAETISWDDKKKEWKLDNAVERKINGMNEDISQYPFYPLKMGYKPMDLIHDEYRKDKLKTPDLNQLIEKEQRRGSEAVVPLRFERYRRDSNALSVLIMTLMAGILASRKIRGGSGFHMAVAFVLGVTFILVDKFSMVFCIKGNLNPFIAAWLPPFLFGLLTMRLYIKSPK
jgi:lipopolysaccharide export system permease protein